MSPPNFVPVFVSWPHCGSEIRDFLMVARVSCSQSPVDLCYVSLLKNNAQNSARDVDFISSNLLRSASLEGCPYYFLKSVLRFRLSQKMYNKCYFTFNDFKSLSFSFL